MARRTKVKTDSDIGSENPLSVIDDDFDEFIDYHEGNIEIDEHDLNGCLTQQSVSYYQVSKRLALESSRRDAAKTNLKETESTVDIRLRETARKTSTKMTETELSSRRQIDPDVVEAEKVLTRCKHRVAQMEALERTFSQRAYVIRDLCQLWISSYYSNSGDDAASSAVRSRTAEHNKKELNKLRK